MNAADFQTIISDARSPLIVDFWAPWCVPCRVTKPILEKLASEYAGRITFLPVNADEAREVIAKYRVAGIPTVMAFQDGQLRGRVTGAQTESAYRSMFESLAVGRPVKVPLATFDRTLRLGAGALFVLAGVSTGSWLLAVLGSVLAFLGIYDRCPVWAALTTMLKRAGSAVQRE